MRFDIYGRFTIAVVREDDRWRAYHVGEGKRRPAPDVIIPEDANEAEILGHLEVIFHEFARPARMIRRLG